MTSGGCGVVSRLAAPPGTPIVIPAYELAARPSTPDIVRAGVGRVDITPPAGYPTGGHGPAGNLARGYWTRLYARAFYIQDAARRSVLLVSCDLFAIPGGLRAAVMQKTAPKWSRRGVLLPQSAYVIAATHTHQSPGNYMSAGVYNAFGSKYGGFDRKLFDFLVDRVSQSIDIAIQDALEHDAPTLVVRTELLHTPILLNRSPLTFLLNWNATSLADAWNPWNPERLGDCRPDAEEGEAATLGWNLAGCPRLRAADPAITALQIWRGDALVGALVFLAVHPTVLYHGAPFYSSDFVGVAMRSLERQRQYGLNERFPVLGFFNGAEGDVVARRGRRDIRDVVFVATRLKEAVPSVLTRGSVPLSPVMVETRHVAIAPKANVPGSELLASEPVFGTAAVGGAEDDRTVLYQLGWREGVREVPTQGQGGKLPALDSQLLPFVRLTHLVAPPRVFPQELPVSYIRIGTFQIGAVPAELSSAQGAALREAFGPHGTFELIGLANEYASYVATSDEYQGQDYMGASTIWGPQSGRALELAMNHLRTCCVSDETSVPKKRFFPGPKPQSTLFKEFGAPAVGERLPAPESELERVLMKSDGTPARNLPSFVWMEHIADRRAEDDATTFRRIRILERAASGWKERVLSDNTPDNDDGVGVITLVSEAPARGAPYVRNMLAIWVSPVLEKTLPRGEFKFEASGVDTTGRWCWESQPFTVDLTPVVRPVPLSAMLCSSQASKP